MNKNELIEASSIAEFGRLEAERKLAIAVKALTEIHVDASVPPKGAFTWTAKPVIAAIARAALEEIGDSP